VTEARDWLLVTDRGRRLGGSHIDSLC